MFWGLAAGRVDGRGFEFEHVLEGIQTLNEWALEGRLEVTAISLHTYPFVQDKYVILPHGASMGSGYGPVVVAKRPIAREELKEIEVAVPGRMTTAFLVLRFYLGGDFRYREVPFDEIMEEVESGEAEAGLLIHEGQLTYKQRPRAHRRSRRVVASRNRAPAPARHQHRPARPRRRRRSGRSRTCSATRSVRASSTARRRSSMPSSSGEG